MLLNSGSDFELIVRQQPERARVAGGKEKGTYALSLPSLFFSELNEANRPVRECRTRPSKEREATVNSHGCECLDEEETSLTIALPDAQNENLLIRLPSFRSKSEMRLLIWRGE